MENGRKTYWRVSVERWDDDYVYVYRMTGEGHSSACLCISLFPDSCSTYKEWDWSYVRRYLRRGTQLNLVCPRVEGDVVWPELVIVEPDYLVDISAIAACFEDYGASSLAYLLRQLAPLPASPAILMGSLAGQLLDEVLSLPPAERTYAKSARRFFEKNALALMATPVSPHFHSEARRQARNIENALDRELPQRVVGFDAGSVMLEPSFLSEMLGLQGRMDFLTTDFSVLIEQKAGQCGWPQSDPATPVQAEKHFVQMLLYMLLVRYGLDESVSTSAFLLYSRYEHSLLELGFEPRLVFEALRLRNEIVAAEFAYTRGGMHFLTTLTADDLNVRHRRGKLWTHYQRPQLEALLQPIRDASPLEQAYFLRMMAFLHTEHLMQKVGDGTAECQGAAEKWRCSLAEKQESGSIVVGLKPFHLPSGGRVSELVFAQPELQDYMASDFRKGDIVIVYPYAEGCEPDARRGVVHRATIVELTPSLLRVRLRTASLSPDATTLWAMEHDFMEASSTALYRGLHAMLTTMKARRDLLLMQRRPVVDATLRLMGDYGEFNELAQRVVQARDLFLIIGPPGTGKTSFGLMTTVRESLLRDAQSSILLAAYTNRAVDEICSRLVADGIDFARVGNEATADEVYHKYLLSNRIAATTNVDEVRHLVAATRVFVGTTTAVSAATPLLMYKHFDLAVIDEASQILEPHLLTLWSAVNADGRQAIESFVLIGDHKQLPAVVQQPPAISCVKEAQLIDIGLTDCRHSLFERMARRYADDPAVCYMLTRQGRMHPDIADFPNHAFYDGRLTDARLPHQCLSSPTARIAFFDVLPPVSTPSDKVNEAEARVIADIVHEVYECAGQHFDAATTVGVIVPYRNQIAAVRRQLDAFNISALSDVTIDTVERFQGSQRDTIIYGFTVREPYQMDFLTSNVFEDNGHAIDRKLNVALTRAREQLFLVGNAALLADNPVFASLINHVRKHGRFCTHSTYSTGATSAY